MPDLECERRKQESEFDIGTVHSSDAYKYGPRVRGPVRLRARAPAGLKGWQSIGLRSQSSVSYTFETFICSKILAKI
jgi:hypothetical protein